METDRQGEADAELSRCIIGLLLKEPFFGHLLGQVSRDFTDDVPTLSVSCRDGQVILSVNPDFFLENLVNRSQRTAVVKHEALHLVFKHIFRGNARRIEEIWLLACEVVVNQYVGDWELPENAITLKTFGPLDLEPEQTADHYYERLLQESKSRRVTSALQQEHFCDQSDWGEPEEPSQAEGQAPSEGSGALPSPGAAPDWVEAAGVERLIAKAHERTATHEFGALPDRIQELLQRHRLARNAVDWRRALRLFASSSRRTRIQGTMRRESRRFMTIPGIKVKRYQKLAVAVDTSGSVDSRQIAAVFAEIHAMWRAGAEIDVVECDAEVQRTWRYTGTPPTDIEGRGGTAFDPVFEQLRNDRRVRYDACIYITDGHGPTPTRRPPCKLLWLLTHDGSDDTLVFGRVVRLPPVGRVS